MRGKIEALLGAAPMFAHARPEELRGLAKRCQWVRLPARSVLFSRGDPGSRLYVLAAGLVRIGVTSAEGREVTYGLISPGQIFGEIAVLDGGPRTADATLVTDCQLVGIDRPDLIAYFDQHPAHYAHLLGILCERVRSADSLIEDLFFLAATNRLAKHLVLLGNTLGDRSGGHVTIHVSQQELADNIGVSRERVNKLLAKWEQAGLVGLWRGRITLRDLDAMEELVRGE